MSSLLQRLHHSFFGRLSIGVSIGVLIFLVKLFFLEHTVPYGNFRLWMYGQIQRTFTADSEPTVQLVDISGTPTISGVNVAPGGAAVSRDYLYDRLEEIAQAHPKAIGVDVDFSPDEHGNPISMDDPEFFAKCRKLSETSGIPIFLGVHRQAASRSDQWLGAATFRDMAAGLGVGNREFQAEAGELKAHVPSVLRMLSWTQVGKDGAELKSLAFAVAEKEIEEGSEPPAWLRWALEVRTEFNPEEALRTEGFLVSYRLLDRFLESSIPIGTVSKARKETFENRFVLLGDVKHIPHPTGEESREDLFEVPGRQGLYSGVILHASAVDTLVYSPLRQWTPAGRAFVDIGIAVLAFFLIEALKPWFRRTKGTLLDWSVVSALVLGVVAISIPFANSLKLVWDDGIFVGVCLLLHTYADQSLSRAIHRSEHHHESPPVEPEEPELEKSEEPQCVE